MAAELRDGDLSPQSFQDDLDLVFGGELAVGGLANLLNDVFGG